MVRKSLQARKRLVRKSFKRKGTKRKRRKSSPEKVLREKLWELCKQITRLRYGNVCYTCDAPNLSGSNWHTAHFIARSVCGNYLKYDLRNLRPGCYRCNISLAGNGAVFYRRLVAREGQEYVDQLFADKERVTKLTSAFLTEKIAQYEEILSSLSSPASDTEKNK